MSFFKVIEHLLPTGRAWRLQSEKMLRKFLEGVAPVGDDVKTFFDEIWFDIFPETTRQLSSWESRFDLRDTGLDEQGRRDRLDGAWKALGGQDCTYLQNTLRDAGFDVYVHEWWELGSDPPIARDPTTVIKRFAFETTFLTELGDVGVELGEAQMELGNSLDPQGYPLVNKFFPSQKTFIAALGVDSTALGEENAALGQYDGLEIKQQEYFVEDDPDQFPYYIYVGGVNFGDIATVDAARRDELERLILKHFPTHLWVGMLVKYS